MPRWYYYHMRCLIVYIILGLFVSPTFARSLDYENWLKEQKEGFCHLHQVKMEKKQVPIIYGLVRPDDQEILMYKKEPLLFPHAKDYVLGGCSIQWKKSQKLFECSQCRKAKENWLEEHPKSKNQPF